MNMGKFVVKQTKTGFKFDLKANNGEVIATSEVYTTEAACMNGLESVRKNAEIAQLEDQTVENYEAKTHPKFEIEKEYLVVIAGGIEREEILKLQSGVIIDGIKTAPCKIKRCDATEHTTSLSVILHEGRNRQVRKMFEAVGKNVLHLTRIRHGELVLSGLKPGQWRYLNAEEIAYLENLK